MYLTEPLKSENMKQPSILLRAVEFDDTDIILQWENDSREWHHSGTTIPFSRYQIEQYVLNASSDFWSARQVRLMITLLNGITVGAVDLFEADPLNRRAGIGITIDARHRRHGYASEALTAIATTSFSRLGLHQLWCNIALENEASLRLFENAGFQKAGIRRDWLHYDGQFHDVWFLQLLNPNR